MRRILEILSLLACHICLAGCADLGSDIVYDIAPITLHVYVNDGDGRNLLDEENGALDAEKITVSYKGEIYGARRSEAETKAYLPVFSGLEITKDFYGNSLLTFGELDGADNMDNEDIVISWGDGTSDTITVFNKCKYKVNGDLSITRRFYVNGKNTKSDIAKFVFVK